jgi:uncharacterized protein YnzC (UPF0291/DUF896 family)
MKMEINELIAKINFLYHKRQAQGLTEIEQIEQTELRRQYIEIIKGNFQGQLERIRLVDENTEEHCSNPECDCKKH